MHDRTFCTTWLMLVLFGFVLFYLGYLLGSSHSRQNTFTQNDNSNTSQPFLGPNATAQQVAEELLRIGTYPHGPPLDSSRLNFLRGIASDPKTITRPPGSNEYVFPGYARFVFTPS